MMKIAKLLLHDIANGPGIRISLWVQGCPIHCPGCFNQETWDFNKGYSINSIQLANIIIQEYQKFSYSGISFLGGECLCAENAPDVLQIIIAIKKALPDINIWLWTGYYLEDLYNLNDKIINNILNIVDTVVAGPFLIKDRDLTLKWRGSRNQTIYHLNKGEIISIEN